MPSPAFLPGTQRGVLGLSQCLWKWAGKRRNPGRQGWRHKKQSPEEGRRRARVQVAVLEPQRPSHDSDAPPGLLLTSVHLRCVSWLAGPCCCSGDPLEEADSKAGGIRTVNEPRALLRLKVQAQRRFLVFENISALGTWHLFRMRFPKRLTTLADVQFKTQAQKITGKEVKGGDYAPSAWTHSQGTQAFTSLELGKMGLSWGHWNLIRSTKRQPKWGLFYPRVLRRYE